MGKTDEEKETAEDVVEADENAEEEMDPIREDMNAIGEVKQEYKEGMNSLTETFSKILERY